MKPRRSPSSPRLARIGQLNDYEMSPLLHAVAARTALRRGESPEPEHLARAMRRRPLLTAAVPYRAVQTRLELAHAHLALTDVAGARTLLREARYILQQRPHLGILPSQAALLQSKLDSLRETTTSAATLTNAELRLLPLMSTHLTFREMGERLYLSPHTVKSQALSVYRKLGCHPAARRSSARNRPACSAQSDNRPSRPLTPEVEQRASRLPRRLR